MRIALLHTSDVHVGTFDQLFADLDADVHLDHHVDASLLDRAIQDGTEAVRPEVETLLITLSDADAVLCTCSTLGPLTDEVARSFENIIRIDRPLMERACADGGNVLVALCLDSTRAATLELLTECAKEAGKDVNPIVVLCSDAWAFFEEGDMEAYAHSIAGAIKSTLLKEHDVQGIVLAQASMRVSEAKLQDTGVAVFSSPVIAAQKCLAMARSRR